MATGMEAGALTTGQDRTASERLAELAARLNAVPYGVKAGVGIFVLDLILVLADRWPDSGGEWVLLAAILVATIAAVTPLEARPSAIAGVVLANVVALLLLYHGINDVAQRGINGLSLGAIYALGAVGLTLVYGILKLVNFAHGDFLAFGAYMAYLVNVTWGVPLIYAIVFAIAATAFLGVALEKGMFAPMRRKGAGVLQLLLMTLALGFVIRYTIQFAWSTELRQLDVNRSAVVDLPGDLRVGRIALIVIIVGFVSLVATGLMLRWTLLGKRMRALSDNLDLAETSGIDTSRVIVWTWVFAAGLAGLAGVFYGATTQLQPEMGFELLLPIFAAVVLGGIGNAFGALTAGIVLGVVIEWSTLFLASGLKLVVGFAILIIVLVIRPEGIFGRARTV
jgi:neutral amino acid transport system permease protein